MVDGFSMPHTMRSNLKVALRLHEAPHNTKGCIELALAVCGHGRDDRVIGPLVWAQAVGVPRVQYEVVPSILQREAAALWHNACR